MASDLVKAQDRLAAAKKAQADAAAALSRKQTESKSAKDTADKLAADVVALTAKSDSATAAAKAVSDRCTQLTTIKAFADLDAKVAAAELDVAQATSDRAALPPDDPNIAAADKKIKDTTAALDKLKTDEKYDTVKKAADKAQSDADKADAAAKAAADKAAKKVALQSQLNQIASVIDQKTKEKNDLFARYGSTSTTLADLQQQQKDLNDQLGAL